MNDSSATTIDWAALADRLARTLHLTVPPITISFTDDVDASLPSFEEPMSEPTADGRSGRVPAGCVFWIRAAERSFATAPADHGNCSVGSLHARADAASRRWPATSDVAALLDVGMGRCRSHRRRSGGLPAVEPSSPTGRWPRPGRRPTWCSCG